MTVVSRPVIPFTESAFSLPFISLSTPPCITGIIIIPLALEFFCTFSTLRPSDERMINSSRLIPPENWSIFEHKPPILLTAHSRMKIPSTLILASIWTGPCLMPNASITCWANSKSITWVLFSSFEGVIKNVSGKVGPSRGSGLSKRVKGFSFPLRTNPSIDISFPGMYSSIRIQLDCSLLRLDISCLASNSFNILKPSIKSLLLSTLITPWLAERNVGFNTQGKFITLIKFFGFSFIAKRLNQGLGKLLFFKQVLRRNLSRVFFTDSIELCTIPSSLLISAASITDSSSTPMTDVKLFFEDQRRISVILSNSVIFLQKPECRL